MVSAEQKKKRRKEGKRRKKAARVEVPLPSLKDEKEEIEIIEGLLEEDRQYERFEEFKDILKKGGVDVGDSDSENPSEKDDEDSEEGAMYNEVKKRKSTTIEQVANRPNKKERRQAGRLTVAHLKTLVEKPDLVETHDPNSTEPLLLVQLKSLRNTVPIPQHWCQKSRYLSLKRQGKLRMFQLPHYIAELGIARIREELLQRDSNKRGEMTAGGTRAKYSRVNIDYEKFERAFRKPVKPPMSEFGEMYYEGKERDAAKRKFTPGLLSERLKNALGMAEGHPPPYLWNMQRYGPPRSYPNLKIPGLNSPLPPGAQWGYTTGGWGKAPVDSTGRPLYGDVFGKPEPEHSQNRLIWGSVIEDHDDYYDDAMEGDEDPTMEVDEEPSQPNVPQAKPKKDEVAAPPLVSTEAPGLVDLGLDEDEEGESAVKVLKEIKVEDSERRGVLGPSFRYDLGKDTHTTQHTEQPREEPAETEPKKDRKRLLKF